MPPTKSAITTKNDTHDAKRQKPNTAVGSALRKPKAPQPDYDAGLKYWEGVEASNNGVLGGFGDGPVPHIDALASRLLLLSLHPSLASFPNPLTPQPSPKPSHPIRALEVGAGIGRVSRDVLVPLFDEVIVMEPVEKFLGEALRSAQSGEWKGLREEKGRAGGRGKKVWFAKRGLQGLDPGRPFGMGEGEEMLGVVGGFEEGKGIREDLLEGEEEDVKYDVIWCQWCLGHISTPDLIDLLKMSKKALRDENSLIFVKENTCEDAPGGKGAEFLDEEDSSLTRSDKKWLEIFKDAGLDVIKEEVQVGMPEELFVVKTYVMR